MSDSLDILVEELGGNLWSAALENGKLVGLEIDPPEEEVRWGSIYRARIKTIDAALDAVYVDLDGDNTGILYNADTRHIDKDGTVTKGGAEAIGKRFQAGDVITVQAKSAYIASQSDPFTGTESKIPQVSMDITLQGRYLIYCPLMMKNRISQRIRDKKLRAQIEKMLNNLDDIKGCIVRAAAANAQTEILLREGKILKATWDQMQEHLKGSEVGLIMEGPDAIQRTLSDQAGHLIDRIEVVTMDHYNHAEEWCTLYAPDLVTKIDPLELDDASEDLALFHYRDIIGQIEDLFHAYVLLPGGGNLIIQSTAALTAIDINRGGDKAGNLAINTQAAREIARQMRLRNTGGIVVVDFLTVKDKKEEKALLSALEDAVQRDPCTVQIHGMTKLGLLEMTRKRRTPPLGERLDGLF